MSGASNNRRPRRQPLTREEVAKIREYKQRLERINLKRFKQSRAFVIFNVFNICSFFVFIQVLLCFVGPADYSRHYGVGYKVDYSTPLPDGTPVIHELSLYGVDGKTYVFVVNGAITLPDRFYSFVVGKDYILRKQIKGGLDINGAEFRLFHASPVLLLCALVSFISMVAFIYDINENPYSLKALTVLNFITMLGIIAI